MSLQTDLADLLASTDRYQRLIEMRRQINEVLNLLTVDEIAQLVAEIEKVLWLVN